MKCVKISVNGIVQGVGFRPFVYRLASENSLNGYVKNLGDAGVEIVVEGAWNDIENFINQLKLKAPPLARVEKIEVKIISSKGFNTFTIQNSSSEKQGGDSIIPPDIAICEDCLKELFDPTDRRYMYPFIVCTNCGPRFSIIESLPYDRENTSMSEFPMCKECREEYENPIDRRYHAEPVCCPACGPNYTLVDRDGNKLKGDPLRNASRLIDEGQIIAIKGIGGFHIACNANDDEAIETLRKRVRRPQQPFAIMAKDMEVIKSFAMVDKNELEEMISYRRPIILLRKKRPFPLPDSLSPGLHTIGVMLPYAPVHHIMFHYSKTPVYVMTSANYPDFPMVKDNERIVEIKDVVDYFLIHNRKIVNRVDDSVVRFVDGKRAIIRRSRGFVPLPVGSCYRYSGIALGAELMNSVSIIKNGKVYPSQYIGNTSKVEVLEFMKEAIEKLRKLISLDSPELIIVDSHPLYHTSRFGKDLSEKENVELLRVQHHKAHIASVMLEYEVEEMIGIAIDAVGYGSDGKIWGGEIFSITQSNIKRLAHISYYPIPGGDLAAHYPLRSLIGLLSKIYKPEEIESIIQKTCPRAIDTFKHKEEFNIVFHQIEKRINTPETSSTGRFLDAISVLLNLAYKRTYEGEPAMKLESFAMGGKDMNIEVEVDGEIKLHTIIPQILDLPGEDAAYSVHTAIGRAFAREAVRQAEELGIKSIGVSGGVAYNQIIISTMRRIVENSNLKFLVAKNIPRGDNGISAGQAYLGGLYLNGNLRRDEIE